MHSTNTIWTIGHSTRSFEEFMVLLKSFNIELLADVRNHPGSKKFPHFNKEFMEVSLPIQNIEYMHLKELGGRRKPNIDSHNSSWNNMAFRGYADYMETTNFKEGICKLVGQAAKKRTAYMCAEAVWWRCHRALISDYLKSQGWTVNHITNAGKAKEHIFTSVAIVENNELHYRGLGLQ